MDQSSPLTDKEKKVIQGSWAKVYPKSDDVGVASLVSLFTKYPQTKQYFSQFKHIENPEELKGSAQLRKHAHTIMNALNKMVENLGNSDAVASEMNALGKSHAQAHKVDPMYFKIMSGVIMEVLGEEFPEAMTPDVVAAWTRFWAMFCSGVTAVYDKVGWTKVAA